LPFDVQTSNYFISSPLKLKTMKKILLFIATLTAFVACNNAPELIKQKLAKKKLLPQQMALQLQPIALVP
jgi:hypothetical protein